MLSSRFPFFWGLADGHWILWAALGLTFGHDRLQEGLLLIKEGGG